MAEAAWKRYEQQITERLRQRATGRVKITHDVKVVGRMSGVERQIDILVEGLFAGMVEATMVVDCKCFSRNVDVKDVEEFMSMLEDVDVPLGMLVTTRGYSKAAEQRTRRVLKEIVPLVDIAVFDEASTWWLMRAGSEGRYAGDYLDHEPYGKFWWLVNFVIPGDGIDDDEEDVLWSSSDGGWDGQDNGPQLLAALLARHRLARMPQPEEVDNLTRGIERNVEAGQGFFISTREVDDWLGGFYGDDDEVDEGEDDR